MAGLKILYNLILKDTVKGSGSASGILSIGKDVRKLADKKFQRYITTAKNQNVDLDKLSEQEIKYMMELNKPKEPQVLSNEDAYAFLNQFLNQGKKGEVIRGKFKPLVTVDSVITDIKKLKPMDSMKETNKVLRGEGKYKNLSKADREKIAGDESVTDHIFERNIEPDPEDFAGGGVAGMLGERTGYQTGGSPAIDARMLNTYEENIEANRQQQIANQMARFGTKTLQPKTLTGPTTRLYHGTTQANPFGGSKFFATPDKAKAAQYATTGALRGSPFAGAQTGRILQADVPTSQAQSLLKKGLTGTREAVLDPQAAKTLFETGKGTLKGASSLGTKAALAGTKALPVIGGAVSLADAASRLKQGDYVGAGLGAAGAVPVLGLPALGAQVVYDAAKNNPTIQKVGTSIGEGIYNLLNPEAAAATPTEELELVQVGTDKATGAPEWKVVNDPTLDVAETYSEYKARMLDELRKSHGGQKTVTTDLTPTGGYSGVSREIPIEDYFNYMLADAYGHGFNPITGLQFGTDDQGVFTNRYNFKKEMADFKKNNPDYKVSLAGGGIAGMLGEPTYQDEEHRVPYSKGGSISDVLLADFDELDNDELIHIIKLLQAGEIPKFADGGRIGFSEGKGPKMSRRNFLKIMGGLAALPVVGKLFKFAKPAAKAAKVADVTSVPIGNAKGMPAWFKPLVNKVIKEGEDVTKQWASKERQVVHTTKLPDSQTDVLVIQDLDSGNVLVDIGLEKHGFASGKFGQPVRLEYKAAEEIEPILPQHMDPKNPKGFWKPHKDQKTKPEFNVEEAEFTGGHPENVKFEEVTVNKFGDHASDFSEVESFATGKNIKEIQKTKRFTKDAKRDVSEVDWKPTDDYASGGRVPLGGGGLLNLLKTIFKKAPKKSYERVDLKKLLKEKDKIPVYSGSMKRQSNTWKSFIEDAEQLGTTPEKIAKDKFKGQWFTPFRSYAESFMNPKDLTSKMRTVELTPKEIKLAKRYVEKVNKKDLLASMRRKHGIKPYPKHMITTGENLVLIPRYKLKKLEKENRIMTDYLIKDKIKSKLGLAEGGVAGMLGE